MLLSDFRLQSHIVALILRYIMLALVRHKGIMVAPFQLQAWAATSLKCIVLIS